MQFHTAAQEAAAEGHTYDFLKVKSIKRLCRAIFFSSGPVKVLFKGGSGFLKSTSVKS